MEKQTGCQSYIFKNERNRCKMYGSRKKYRIISHNAKLLSKDAFWNSENVTVYDSFISGEYLGWNAKKIDAD